MHSHVPAAERVMDTIDAKRLEQLEMKIAFLERANAELGEVVYRQQQELLELKRGLGVLVGQFDSASPSPGSSEAFR